jgi:hypothetical protein
MISREEAFTLLRCFGHNTVMEAPEILAIIPKTTMAGKLLGEVKKIIIETANDVSAARTRMDQLVDENGGSQKFTQELRQEIRAERDKEYQKYINCVIFWVKPGDSLSAEEQDDLISVLSDEVEIEDEHIAEFVECFIQEYFGGVADLRDDGASEIASDYLAFNFDDTTDHEYEEEDLKIICAELNRIVGREVFDEYDWYGTNDSVKELYG